ncbi:MAG: FAD-binding protein [Clostridia bacterium]|nr:FAD-binding protein [Clostridia bacterium]
MIRLNQVRMELNDYDKPAEVLAARALHVAPAEIRSARIVRKSVDARDKQDVHFTLTLETETVKPLHRLPRNAEEVQKAKPAPKLAARNLAHRPLVVGLGPAGLFAALRLAQYGMEPVVIERGKPVEARMADVETFRLTGKLDPRSNVQFGEGGAGTFSDGKLNSGIKDPRCHEVLETLHRAGAPEEICYLAKPHIGTDNLRKVVRTLREEIISLGGTVMFETQLTGLMIDKGRVIGAELETNGEKTTLETDDVILAVGHSARDTFEMLDSLGVPMIQKAFSIGVRIEHKQQMINRSQYGAASRHPALGAADYKLNVHLPNGRGVYTFCMCPGGEVVAAASEEGRVVVNGMSCFARDGENANSALLVSVNPEDFESDHPLAGVAFQRKWEQAAFELGGGNYHAPAQLVGDFLKNRASTAVGGVEPTYRPGVTWTSLDDTLPAFASESLRMALPLLDRKLKGYASDDAVMTGVETRSSSPVRIVRDSECQSTLRGLYPCGEGAGYAGGILSAAVDGLRCAEALMEER